MGNELFNPNQKNKKVLTIFARGDNSYGNITHLNRPLNFEKIFCENFQCFGIDNKGILYSWGLNNTFQLANGKNDNYLYSKSYNKDNYTFKNNFSILSYEPSKYKEIINNLKKKYYFYNDKIPFPIVPKKIKKITCGDGYSLFLDNEGNIYSVGKNDKGQLGYEIPNDNCNIIEGVKCNNTLTKISFFQKNNIYINNIFSGSDFSFAQDSKGIFYSWGNNKNNQLGRETNTIINFIPEKAVFINEINDIEKIEKLCLGWSSGILLTNNNCYIWGNPFYDYDKTFPNLKTPEKIEYNKSIYKIINIECGFHHFCLIVENVNKNTFSLMTFGLNDFGQLGYETESNFTTEVKVVDFGKKEKNIDVKNAFCGAFHTIVLLENNNIYGFGQNDNKQIGNYDCEYSNKPLIWNYNIDEENIENKTLYNIICGNGITILIYKDKEEYEEEVRREIENKKKYIEIEIPNQK